MQILCRVSSDINQNEELSHEFYRIKKRIGDIADFPITIGEFPKIFQFSKSELNQDLFALLIKNFQYHGFFVEIGTGNGIKASNSYLLEKGYFWRGILVEPAKVFHANISKTRNAILVTKLISNDSGQEMRFFERDEASLSSVIRPYGSSKYKEYWVETINLNDCLKQNLAPRYIDYLSLDVEGYELSILETFNFSEYTISFISVEHNYTSNREKIYELLLGNNYIRVRSDISRYDDFYVHRDVVLKCEKNIQDYLLFSGTN